MRRPYALPSTLKKGDIPPDLRDGCTSPYSVWIRGLVMFLAYLVLFMLSKGLQKHLLETIGLKGKYVDVLTILSTLFALYKLYAHAWSFLSKEMRNCDRYNRFIEYYNEMTLKGMEPKFAIIEAKELIHRDRREDELRRSNISYERRLDDLNSIRIGF